MRAMKENGSPPAEFEFDEDHSYFMVWLPVQPDAPHVEVTLPVTPPVAPPVARLLELLFEEGKFGNADIRQQLGLKDRTQCAIADPFVDVGSNIRFWSSVSLNDCSILQGHLKKKMGSGSGAVDDSMPGRECIAITGLS